MVADLKRRRFHTRNADDGSGVHVCPLASFHIGPDAISLNGAGGVSPALGVVHACESTGPCDFYGAGMIFRRGLRLQPFAEACGAGVRVAARGPREPVGEVIADREIERRDEATR